MRNLQYQRRFKADFANGIGNWLTCLDNMTQGGIIIVCASVYFTSGIYKKMFTTSQEVDTHLMAYQADAQLATWDALYFFITLVAVEHGLLVLKLVVEQLIDDVPEEIQKEEQDRQGYVKKYNEMSERMKRDHVQDDFEDVSAARTAIEKSKSKRTTLPWDSVIKRTNTMV